MNDYKIQKFRNCYILKVFIFFNFNKDTEGEGKRRGNINSNTTKYSFNADVKALKTYCHFIAQLKLPMIERGCYIWPITSSRCKAE